MPPETHAILSASSSHRWLHCPPSAMLQTLYPDTASETAQEGSAAHAICEHLLNKALKRQSHRPVSKYDSDEMFDHCNGYVEFVLESIEAAKEHCSDVQILIEHRLDFSKYVPHGFGTGDCVIVADKIIHVIDFKYGQGVLVEAENNTQMMLYALGALEQFSDIYDIDTVHMSIYQPRRNNVSTFTMSVKDLFDWANNTLVPIAQLAWKGEGEFCAGSWCKFCKASTTCRKRAEENLAIAQHEFALPPTLSDDEIDKLLPQLDGVIEWASALKDYTLKMALQGKVWTGYKLVAGRSNRRYKNESAVISAAKNAGYTDIFKKALLSVGEMEKLMGKHDFSSILGNLIEKPTGKPTLVPLSDKRPALETTSSAFDDFKE